MVVKPSAWRSLLSTRMLVMLLLGFTSGMPLLLVGSTLQAWLTDEHISLPKIGAYSLVGLPYTVKFLWAPLFDRFVPPFLGRRRGWMVITLAFLSLAIFGLGRTHPSQSLPMVALLAFGVTFASASADIVLDAYRRERLPDNELGLGTSVWVGGYRGALLVSGAFALWLADRIPWQAVYTTMSAVMLVGLATTVLCMEPRVDAPPPRRLRETVVEPFAEFFRRRGAITILAFILLYKLGEQLTSQMTAPFVLGLGFTKSELAAIAKLFALVSMIVGGLTGGLLMVRIGIRRSLWVFGALQALAILPYALLAEAGHVYALLAAAVSIENFTSGMATAAYTAYMASLTNKRFTATQYALLSSLTGIPRVILASPTGSIAAALGWTGYFLFCAVIAIPGLLLLFRVAPWNAAEPPEPVSEPA